MKRGSTMTDQEINGDEFCRRAEKKLTGWGLFGNKYEDAADLYEKAVNSYKIAKAWEKAGSTYEKLASCHKKLESRHEEASAYADAANCYKKINPREAIRCLNESLEIFMGIGRLNLAAKHGKDIAELYEAEEDLNEAIRFYERSAELYETEGATSTANQMAQKVAQIAAQLEQYPKAIEEFEKVAKLSINNNLLKYSVKGILLNAGLCQICKGDIVGITNALERYQELDPTFSGTREYKFLADLASAIDEEDVEKFTEVVKEYDSMTRLDAWKTSLLLRAKNALKAKEVEEDDLT
ncbi:alpha-soluble NSF attachment protein isoform X2 [Amborella trichopoda]|uniref:alpha-soluble NSF attachment protein isoform X2 n=1 Tax=Amborella trichopoda TaxID=13333 RepID=UPI0009BEFF82|nr:alpha-soluble NSF attachment protein isoform X2 [Amborella trichopoda]|eukprot:XP_020522507.1 alpha-soluble NSF attachment protein isoform X2 [Amborella trichopoda]